MNRAKPVILLAVATVASLAGCSADLYRNWADQQVDAIVKERADETLGYNPQVEAAVEANPNPTTQAYDKVPLTPKPPPTTSPIEPSDLALSFGPLGPEMLFPSGVNAPPTDEYGQSAAQRRFVERLALGPPAPNIQPERLDLFGSIRYAVEHSRAYKSRMEDVYLATLDVTFQRHLFEPRPFARTALRYNGGQENVDYDTALTLANSIGVRQQLPYGGEIAAQAAVDFVRAVGGNAENGEPASVALTASIPLLKGAGLVNLEPLIQTERQLVYEIRDFEDFRRTFAVDISSQYFRLLTSQQSIADRSTNLASLQSLTARSQALYAAGRGSYIDVQRARQSQLQAEQDLVDAQASYRRALDDFKLVLGMNVDDPLEIVAQELAVDVPGYDDAQAAALAVRYRLDLVTSQDRVEDAQRGVQVAKNGLLPELNITAEGRVGNNQGDPAIALNNDNTQYAAGIALDLPIDRVGERNAYRSSLIQLERANRNHEQLRDEVSAAAREALRLIRSAQVSLEIQRKAVELANLFLDNANERLRQGRSDNRDIVDAQNALLQAQDSYERAKADLQIQVLRFLRDTGTLRVDPQAGAIGRALDRKAIAVNEPADPR